MPSKGRFLHISGAADNYLLHPTPCHTSLQKYRQIAASSAFQIMLKQSIVIIDSYLCPILHDFKNEK